MAANTEFRRGDSVHDLLRKILNVLGGLFGAFNGATGSGGAGSATGTLAVSGNLAISATEVTRPGDTTTYAAADVVGTNPGTILTFSNVARITGGTGYITNVRLIKSTATVSNAVFRLWLYSVAPTAIADNSPFTLLYANRANRLGYVDLPCSTEGTGSDSASAFLTNVNLKFMSAAGSRNLYGVLEAKQAYVPGNAEKFWLELTADQN